MFQTIPIHYFPPPGVHSFILSWREEDRGGWLEKKKTSSVWGNGSSSSGVILAHSEDGWWTVHAGGTAEGRERVSSLRPSQSKLCNSVVHCSANCFTAFLTSNPVTVEKDIR